MAASGSSLIFSSLVPSLGGLDRFAPGALGLQVHRSSISGHVATARALSDPLVYANRPATPARLILVRNARELIDVDVPIVLLSEERVQVFPHVAIVMRRAIPVACSNALRIDSCISFPVTNTCSGSSLGLGVDRDMAASCSSPEPLRGLRQGIRRLLSAREGTSQSARPLARSEMKRCCSVLSGCRRGLVHRHGGYRRNDRQ